MDEEKSPQKNFDFLKIKKGIDDLLPMRQVTKRSLLKGAETTEITDFVIPESFALDEDTD